MKSGIILLLLVTGAFFSCKKETGNIVVDGQGDGTNYNIIRTENELIQGRTVREDSLPGNGLPYNLLGTMTDPVLGKTTASVYAGIALLEPNSDFPNTEEPDSAVLYFPIIDGLNFYGDRTQHQTLKITPIVSNIDGSKVYYQTDKFTVDPAFASYYTGPIFNARYDSVRYKTGKIEGHPGIRIKLSTEMAKKLMQLPKNAFQSNEGLNAALQGIAIVPQDKDIQSGKGGIGVYDFAGENTLGSRATIMLYYRDTETFVFTFGPKAKVITTGITGPYNAEVTTQLSQPDQTFNTTYVQSLSGLKTHIEFPNLFNLVSSGNVAINKATLIFYVDKSQVSNNFSAPPRLNLFRPASLSSARNYLLRDAGTASFGGIYNEASGTYTFTVTRHIQDVLNAYVMEGKDINYGLYLTNPTAEPVLGGRTVIDNTKTKLILTYTKLN